MRTRNRVLLLGAGRYPHWKKHFWANVCRPAKYLGGGAWGRRCPNANVCVEAAMGPVATINIATYYQY